MTRFLLLLSMLGANFALAQTPANDLCVNAEPLTCSTQATGNTLGATDSDTPAGCSVFSNDLGVWYTFPGTGGDMTLSTCGPTTGSTNSLAYMALFAGADCSQISCVGDVGSNPGGVACIYTSSASMAFSTVLGQTYYLFIAANSGNPNTIQFELTLACDPVTGIQASTTDEALFTIQGQDLTFIGDGLHEYIVADCSGRICLKGNTTRNVLSLSQIDDGIYVIGVWNGDKYQSLKTTLLNR